MGNSIKRILVIGATGHFGERICRRLLDEPNIELLLSSRTLKKASVLADTLSKGQHSAAVSACAIDYQHDKFEVDLQSLSPDIVIHTAGPFQDQSYRVAKACIAIPCHYIDLADGRAFVEGFDQLNDAAIQADVLAVSGVSTLPGLSTAVIDQYKSEFTQIESIRMSIAPGHQTPRGVSTIAAVLSYCGKSFTVLENGVPVKVYGWQNLRSHRFPKLGKRTGGACDVPDLSLLPRYIPGVKTVSFHASLEAKWEQAGLWCMGWLSRVGLVRNWNRAIPLFDFISERFIKLGSDRGGMHIELAGLGVNELGVNELGRNEHGKNELGKNELGKNETAKTLTWYIHAQSNHGPEIPCTPAVILARKLARDEMSERGALACMGLFTLEDFDRETLHLDIDWEIQ